MHMSWVGRHGVRSPMTFVSGRYTYIYVYLDYKNAIMLIYYRSNNYPGSSVPPPASVQVPGQPLRGFGNQARPSCRKRGLVSILESAGVRFGFGSTASSRL